MRTDAEPTKLVFIIGQRTASEGPIYYGTADETSLAGMMRNNITLIEELHPITPFCSVPRPNAVPAVPGRRPHQQGRRHMAEPS